ncbi:MAG: 16S rRNA (cytosine(1402)-N(4))-methyltransferase, partial [Candidatus Obscuribacterales bacterium]|nr:16S rRNA (cytosine(1402)-N(4))-methyltransferase [Candidatus Obscuribacterales bacterium]
MKQAAHAGELKTTAHLAEFGRQGKPGRHPATNLFLGIRLLVNREFEEVEQAIPKVIDKL